MISEYLSSKLQNKNTVMFITALLFMAGILSYFNDCEIIVASIVSLVAIFLLVAKKIHVKYALFWLFIFYFGFFNSYFRVKSVDDLYLKAPVDTTIMGQVSSIPEVVDYKTKFFLNVKSVDNESIKAKTYVTVNGEKDLNIGDYVALNARVRKPFKAGNPSQFDYGKYLKNFNTFTTTYVDANDCAVLDIKLSPQWKFMQGLNNVRNRILDSHSKYLKSPNLEILGGIVFGDDAVAPPDYIKSTFVNSGLLHILAASGMNVAFIFGFWFYIMNLLKVPYKINVIGGILMVILYTLMTGLGASVLRAALMLLFILVGKLIDRDAHSISLLSFVAFLLLIYNPAYINDVGFQLSFVVTFGLLTTANVIFEKMRNLKFPDWVKAGIIIPIIAQIWVAPIQMFYFNTISTYSILANIATVPFLSVISFGGFVSSILATISPISDFICMVFDFVLRYALNIVVAISNYFANLPYSLIKTTHPSIVQLLIYYLIVLIVTVIIQLGLNKKLVIAVVGLLFVLLVSTVNIPNHKLEVIAFDVGNADAFLVKTPQNKYFIIDTAKQSYKSKNSTARLVISKYLTDRGIKNIEGMVLTHFDLDHAGGAVDLMNDLNIKRVYVNSSNKKNVTVRKIFTVMNTMKIPYTVVKNAEIMYQEKDFKLTNYVSGILKSDNENSIVTLLSYKDFDMLFTGDAGVEAFKNLKPMLPQNVEVLKVGHHGGRGVVDKGMLQYLGIETSILSTGPNSFGHPTRMTLDILRDTKIYRTDRHNSVKITTNGQKYDVYTFDRQKHKYVLAN